MLVWFACAIGLITFAVSAWIMTKDSSSAYALVSRKTRTSFTASDLPVSMMLMKFSKSFKSAWLP